MPPVSAYAPAPMAPAALGFQYKGVWPRFFAQLIDLVIFGVPGLLLSHFTDMRYQEVLVLAVPFFFLLYLIVLQASGGTLGKRILGMRIVKQDGSKPGFSAALVRTLLLVVDFLPIAFLLGILMIAKSTTKQRLGDRVAKTYVVGK